MAMKTDHGYVTYTRGCRCDTCRAAKAEYMRRSRAASRELRTDGSVPYATHGYNAYQNFYCRCDVCREAKKVKDREQYLARQARKAEIRAEQKAARRNAAKLRRRQTTQ